MSVARLLALLLAAAWYVPSAHAVTIPEAMATCEAYRASTLNNPPIQSNETRICEVDYHVNWKGYVCLVRRFSGTINGAMNCFSYNQSQPCPAGQIKDPQTGLCKIDCAAKPSGTVPSHHVAGTRQCVNQCTRVLYPDGEGVSSYVYTGQDCTVGPQDCEQYNTTGQHYVWNQYFQVCQPVVPECPEGKTVQNGICVKKPDCPAGQFLDGQGICQNAKEECPAGQIKSPEGNCLPGDGQCAAGEARKKDGTCGRDSDGDGEADDDDDNPDNDSDKSEFSGGDSCQNPPTCNGDAILCGQARIQWRIDCNTRKSRNVSGGTCDRVPMCTGEKCDAMEYSSLLMQWRTACAVEKLKNASGGTPGNEGQPDWTKVTGDGNNAGEDPDNPHKSVEMSIDNRLDESGFFSGSGSCPQLGTVQTYFGPVNLDEVSWFCDLLTVTRYILKFLGGFIALGILMGWRIG